MSFDWDEYFRLAEELYDNDSSTLHDNEAENRSSISRAYYAAYNRALEKAPYPPKGRSKHRKLIDIFKQSQDRSENQIGRNLERLRDKRTDADYDTDLGGPEQCALKAETSLELCRRILDALSKI
jgi:uncharacterized protein (UPF0332 family)